MSVGKHVKGYHYIIANLVRTPYFLLFIRIVQTVKIMLTTLKQYCNRIVKLQYLLSFLTTHRMILLCVHKKVLRNREFYLRLSEGYDNNLGDSILKSSRTVLPIRGQKTRFSAQPRDKSISFWS